MAEDAVSFVQLVLAAAYLLVIVAAGVGAYHHLLEMHRQDPGLDEVWRDFYLNEKKLR